MTNLACDKYWRVGSREPDTRSWKPNQRMLRYRQWKKQLAAVVFCDAQMPGHDGLWLTAELRKRYRETAVVLATGVSTVAPGVSMQSGVLAYLVKPLSHLSVIEALKVALEWHTETVATGPLPEDTPERLQEWLDSLE